MLFVPESRYFHYVRFSALSRFIATDLQHENITLYVYKHNFNL